MQSTKCCRHSIVLWMEKLLYDFLISVNVVEFTTIQLSIFFGRIKIKSQSSSFQFSITKLGKLLFSFFTTIDRDLICMTFPRLPTVTAPAPATVFSRACRCIWTPLQWFPLVAHYEYHYLQRCPGSSTSGDSEPLWGQSGGGVPWKWFLCVPVYQRSTHTAG